MLQMPELTATPLYILYFIKAHQNLQKLETQSCTLFKIQIYGVISYLAEGLLATCHIPTKPAETEAEN